MTRRRRDSLSEIIEALLAAEGQASDFNRATRFFQLAALIQWPRDAKSAGIAAQIMLARFVADTFNGLGAREQANYLPTLLQHANPSVIITDFMSDEANDLLTDLGDAAEQDLVANIVRFLISYDPNNVNGRKGPSLKKAYYLLEHGALYGQEPRSWKSYSEAWANYKDVGPFLFVRRYSFSGSLAPDPRSPAFLTSVQRVLEDQLAITRFFAQAKWAAARLRSVLDSRALKNMRLPIFPDELDEIRVSLAPPSTGMIKLLDAYSTSAR